jgi:colanic acid/amylovoran biosynthesis glycosyltransferase
MTGLINLGHEIRIFALAPFSQDFSPHEDLEKYDLVNLADYYGRPKSIIELLKLVINDLFRQTGTFLKLLIRSFNFNNFGRRSLNLSAYFFLRTFSKYQHFDIIYGVTGPTSAKILILKELFPSSKFVVNFVGFDYSSRIRKQGTDIYKDLLEKADLVISHSFYSKDCLISLGCPGHKIIKHPVGIDVSKYTYEKRVIEDNEVFNFITVGRLVEKKAHRIILATISNILKKGKKLKYHIVGDGPLFQDIIDQIATDKLLQKHVTCHGYKTQMQVINMLHKCHVFLQPSITTLRWAEQEDTTTTLLEAQATGMPVIATYHAGIPEVVINNKTGMLIPERNIHDLENAMESFIDNPEKCIWMGKNGRKFVEDNFDINKLNKKLEYVFERLIDLKEEETLGIESTEELKI